MRNRGGETGEEEETNEEEEGEGEADDEADDKEEWAKRRRDRPGHKKLPRHSITLSASSAQAEGLVGFLSRQALSLSITALQAMSAPSPIVLPPDTLLPNSVMSLICRAMSATPSRHGSRS